MKGEWMKKQRKREEARGEVEAITKELGQIQKNCSHHLIIDLGRTSYSIGWDSEERQKYQCLDCGKYSCESFSNSCIINTSKLENYTDEQKMAFLLQEYEKLPQEMPTHEICKLLQQKVNEAENL